MPRATPETAARRASRSPLRTARSRAPGAVRGIGWIRFLFYLVTAPTFLYGLYVQLVTLKGPDRTPLPASIGFGRDTVFLTFHGNLHCTWYACLCLLSAFLALDPARRGKRRVGAVARSIERAAHRWTGVLFPLGAFVGLAYYLILHFHPLNRLRAVAVPDLDQKMALLHLHPLVFVVGDCLLKDADLLRRHGMAQARAVRGIMSYGVGYFSWTLVCVRFNGGHWPYPFQPSFSAFQHVVFLATVMLVAAYLTRFGYKLHARVDRRSRLRAERLAEASRVNGRRAVKASEE